MLFFNTTLDGLQFGLCYAVLAIALYISYTILDFPDLSVDGIFPFGGIVGTIVMYKLGASPLVAILFAFVAGVMAGAITGILHVKCGISKLLCGIIVMTGFASITLALTMLLTKTGNTAVLFDYKSNGITGLFNLPFVSDLSRREKAFVNIVILAVIVIVVKIAVDLFLRTKIGFLIRATGDNEQMITSMGKDAGNCKILGLMIADGLVGISGCLYSQLMFQYDNTSGTGKVVIALVSVIMGMAIFRRIRFVKDTTSVIIGAIIYSLALYYFTIIDKNGIFLKLFNAIFFTAVLILSSKYTKFHRMGFKALKKNTDSDKERKEVKDNTDA